MILAESLPSNLQLQSGHMPTSALVDQLLASDSGCASSGMQPPPLPLWLAHCHTKRQWEFLLPPSSPSPSNFCSTSPTDLKSPFSSSSGALSTQRRYQPDSFYVCRNSTIFQTAEFWLQCTTPPSLSPHQPPTSPPPKTTGIHAPCLFREGCTRGFFFEPFLFGCLLIFWWVSIKKFASSQGAPHISAHRPPTPKPTPPPPCPWIVPANWALRHMVSPPGARDFSFSINFSTF